MNTNEMDFTEANEGNEGEGKGQIETTNPAGAGPMNTNEVGDFTKGNEEG